MNANIYDRQLASDGRVLRFLGLMLQRDEHGVASPAPASLFLSESGTRGQDSSSVEVATPAADAQMGCSPHGENTLLPRCAWCDQEAGIAPDPHHVVSHGICAPHHAKLMAQLNELRRIAA